MQMTALLWILCVFLSPLLVLLLFWVSFFFPKKKDQPDSFLPVRPKNASHLAESRCPSQVFYLLLFDQTINHRNDPRSLLSFRPSGPLFFFFDNTKHTHTQFTVKGVFKAPTLSGSSLYFLGSSFTLMILWDGRVSVTYHNDKC